MRYDVAGQCPRTRERDGTRSRAERYGVAEAGGSARDHFGHCFESGLRLQSTYEAAVGDAKRDAILRAWEQAQGDYKEAAVLLGIHPNSLLRLIRRHGLRELLKRGASA